MSDYAENALVRGMQFLAEQQAAIANNLANADSTGYKRRVSQAQLAASPFAESLTEALGTIGYSERVDWTPGALAPTGDSMHVAIDGDGFFLVQDAHGNRYYTRSGAMQIDAQGHLVNTAGERYLDNNAQPVGSVAAASVGAGQLRIADDGTLSGNGTSFGRLGVFKPSDASRLTPIGQARYAAPAGDQPLPAPGKHLRQGSIERSNVEVLTELVSMISVQRSFQGTQRVLGALDRMKTDFVTQLGR